MSEKKFMTKEQILEAIRQLGLSQGFYSRLYIRLLTLQEENPDQYNAFMDELESQQFCDPVDLVLYIET